MEIHNNSETSYPEKDTNILIRPPSMHTTLRTQFSRIIYLRNYNVTSIGSYIMMQPIPQTIHHTA